MSGEHNTSVMLVSYNILLMVIIRVTTVRHVVFSHVDFGNHVDII